MNTIDWTIVFGLILFLMFMALYTKRFVVSVADFLVASRCAGRYLISVALGIAGLGAISLIAWFEAYYQAGFSALWWSFLLMPIALIMAMTGFVIYRYRQTRAMTLAQFFEMRYSRRFRIFAGIVQCFAGVTVFGVYPSVGSRFFVYFCGLPEYLSVASINIPTYVLIMVVLLTLSLFFTFMGGQIVIIVTDFFQGLFCNIVFVVLAAFVLIKINWHQISEALLTAPENASMINPFNAQNVDGFNPIYFLIAGFGLVYARQADQGSGAYNACALNAHEAKMGSVLAYFKSFGQVLIMMTLTLGAFTIMHNPDFTELAKRSHEIIACVSDQQIAKQMTVPIVLTTFLPSGLKGALCAVMFAAFISTHDTYLHSWGSVFLQDVIMPFRKKPFTPKAHIRYLRMSILGVAIYIFLFSLLYKHREYLAMFMAIAGTIFIGGAGSVIIGGLYTRWGTTRGAYVALITGMTISVATMVVRQFWPEFPLDGQRMKFFAIVCSILSYVGISVLQRRRFNLDKMLYRGKYAKQELSDKASKDVPATGFDVFRLGKEFTKMDKVIYLGTSIYSLLLLVIFILGGIWYKLNPISNDGWLRFWHIYIWVMFGISFFTTIWFASGGFVDIFRMFRLLKTIKRDEKDDGMVYRDVDEEDGTSNPIEPIKVASDEDID